MAKNVLVDLNLNQNELQNGVIQNLASNPASGIAGQLYYNTAVNKLRVFDGTDWVNLEKGTGTVTSVAVSNATNGGLSVSGSPITSSGTISVGHSNVLSAAQTTQAIYPIKWDKNGHITGSGTAIDMTTYAPLNNPALTGTPTAPTATAGTNTTQIATTAFVSTAVSAVAGGMVFKGTIGTGGTAGSTLPTSGVKKGDTYKIVTAGTYDGQAAKVGDLFIATATTPTWAYVPSGDDTDVTQVTAGAGLNTTSADTSTDGGSITSTGTLYLTKTAVTPGTYQGITVDKYGRVTGASNMGYTTNTGTVTSVAVSNDTNGGLTVTGSPITTSGTIKLKHTNQITAQTTQAVYPIKIDVNGHISAYGSAVTILKKYSTNITGNGSTTTFTVTHNLGTRDITVQVYDGATYDDVIVDTVRATTNTVTVTFATAPVSAKVYRVVCIG